MNISKKILNYQNRPERGGPVIISMSDDHNTTIFLLKSLFNSTYTG